MDNGGRAADAAHDCALDALECAECVRIGWSRIVVRELKQSVEEVVAQMYLADGKRSGGEGIS